MAVVFFTKCGQHAALRHPGVVAGLLLALLPAWVLAADDISHLTAEDIENIHTLEPEVEALVARTKPATWAARHSCLYYALAGRHLLMRQGIATKLMTGSVIYAPRTQYRHSIHPHAWLETGSHFIDFATLPRLGKISVIPLHQVARSGREVRRGMTQVLTLARPRDPDHMRYLASHCALFKHGVEASGDR